MLRRNYLILQMRERGGGGIKGWWETEKTKTFVSTRVSSTFLFGNVFFFFVLIF